MRAVKRYIGNNIVRIVVKIELYAALCTFAESGKRNTEISRSGGGNAVADNEIDINAHFDSTVAFGILTDNIIFKRRGARLICDGTDYQTGSLNFGSCYAQLIADDIRNLRGVHAVAFGSIVDLNGKAVGSICVLARVGADNGILLRFALVVDGRDENDIEPEGLQKRFGFYIVKPFYGFYQNHLAARSYFDGDNRIL